MAGEVDQTARDMLAIAKKNSDRLSRLINQILDLEKIESGRMHFQRWPVDVDGLLNAALEAHSAYAQQFDVTLRRSDRLSGVRVLGDEDGLMQVLANLISNAIKFSPTGSTVTLSAIQCGRTVRFGVRDEGQGIPHDDQSRIFDRFEQLDASDTRSIQGTGLGLSISRAIVMAHDGEIGVKSTLGAGSLFYFEIPVSQGD
jgi:signal transduction histidine kinase